MAEATAKLKTMDNVSPVTAITTAASSDPCSCRHALAIAGHVSQMAFRSPGSWFFLEDRLEAEKIWTRLPLKMSPLNSTAMPLQTFGLSRRPLYQVSRPPLQIFDDLITKLG
jgi:hypothetical protein